MTQKRIGVAQEWLSADKRAARQAAAEAMVERERIAGDVAIADVRLQTALSYLEVYYAAQALSLAELMAHHAHEELEAATGRLASSSGSSQEVLALVAARGDAEDELRKGDKLAASRSPRFDDGPACLWRRRWRRRSLRSRARPPSSTARPKSAAPGAPWSSRGATPWWRRTIARRTGRGSSMRSAAVIRTWCPWA